jgi:uncharacterized protein (DUF486 family)
VLLACVPQALMLQLPSVTEMVPQMDEPDPELLWMVSDKYMLFNMLGHCPFSSCDLINCRVVVVASWGLQWHCKWQSCLCACSR